MRRGVLSWLAACALASPALADEPDPANDDGKTEVIHVTETTVQHDKLVDRAPVSVITHDDLTAAGRATLGDILQSIPSQANAGNAQVNAGGDGAARVNLRGLGAARTLVVINGRRIGNGGPGADASVDINAIPLAAIERIEIHKDGASARYGADAVGGVVDIITRPQYDGVDVSLLTSTSQRGDGTEYDLSGVTGFTSKDKQTYLVVSGGYQHHDPVYAGDRDFARFQNTYDFGRKTAGHDLSDAAPTGRLDTAGLGVALPGCTTRVCKPLGDGTWANFGGGDGYNEAEHDYLYTPSTRYSLFATGGNRLNDRMALFVEVLYQHRESARELSAAALLGDVPISKDSIYNPTGIDLLGFQRRMTELGPRRYVDRVTMIRGVVGVTGELPDAGGVKDWTYEVSYNYTSTDSLLKTEGQLNKFHLQDSLGPSMYDANGTPICVKVPGDASTQIFYREVRAGYESNHVPCLPLNFLVPGGKLRRADLTDVTFTDAGDGNDSLNTVLATAHGKLAELPHHGELALSVGGDYRREIGVQDPANVASAGYTTDNEAHTTDYRFHIYEGFADLAIVPLAEHEIARRVQLDLGARAMRHGRFGTDVTYKLGGLFRTVHGLAARATYATAWRAPTIFDLAGGRTETQVAAEDPCDAGPPSADGDSHALSDRVQAQCTAQGVPAGARFHRATQRAFIGGSQTLKAESAATITAGVVFEPPEVPGLAITADYWRIAIDHAIETLGVQTIFANCYDRGIQAFCGQIHRDTTTHQITAVDQFLQNVDQTRTSGLDVAVLYDTRLPDELGRVHAALEGQYLFDYDLETARQTIHGVGYYDLGVYPHLKANLSGRWSQPGGASGGFSLRYIGGYQECAGNDCNLVENRATAHDVDRYVKLDVFGGYDFHTPAGLTSVQLGINNVIDATPPVVYNAPAGNSDATTYDFVGRMFYLRLTQLF